jgi:HEPN domain-containing protein
LLARAGNRNAAYLAEQAAEKVIRAVLTSEGTHAGVRHDLREMVGMVPDVNPLKTRLAATVPLAAYATSYRYPTTSRVPQAPDQEVLNGHLTAVQAALDGALGAFGVDLANPSAVATRQGPLR